jgi:hypothetical protein
MAWSTSIMQRHGMRRRTHRSATALTAVLALAGCGIGDAGPMKAGPPATGGLTADGSRVLRVYFVTPHGTWPVTRPAPPGTGPQDALDALLTGPTPAERARGLVTMLPASSASVRVRASPGTVDLHLPWLVADLDAVAVSQLVCTAAAAPGVPGGRQPVDVAVRVFESGLPRNPWAVRCDETGSATPVGGRRPSP